MTRTPSLDDPPSPRSLPHDVGGHSNGALIWKENSLSPHHGEHHALTRHEAAIPPKPWKFRMRGYDDEEDTDWWFASTAIPLLAATMAPLANVLSIAALVTYWRMDLSDGKGGILEEARGITFKDPRWCYWLNVVSLICGFLGNLFLLFNFTGRIRYIIALPATIFLWYVATGILIAITAGMHIYVPPIPPLQIYTQGYWYAVMAAILYFICSMILMINMLGYFLGHYPQRFNLNDHQRTLILQTMLFFVWLAGGGALFARIENGSPAIRPWSFVDGLYFCDVTILTVGFGDLYLTNDIGRGLVFPYSVGGIITLGLVISSISKFAGEMSQENVIHKHLDKVRTRTVERTVTDPLQLERMESELALRSSTRQMHISGPFNGRSLHLTPAHHHAEPRRSTSSRPPQRRGSMVPPIRKRTTVREVVKSRSKKILLLREEKDRFDEMRRIQNSATRFRRWWALTVSVGAFSILWILGAVVFWQAEKNTQDMTYFQALYFCYVSLLTIGYGDLAPKSNAGRPFFVVWSLIAVPTMTILISDMSSTVVESFKRGTFRLADFTVLPQEGAWRAWLEGHPRLLNWLRRRKAEQEKRQRLKQGIPFPDSANPEMQDKDEDERAINPDLGGLTDEVKADKKRQPNEAVLARRLALAIRKVAEDFKSEHKIRYSFEHWAEFTRLIRFTTEPREEALAEEEAGLIEWDWIGEDSPMMTNQTEPEFLLDRLTESLDRYMRRVERRQLKHSEANHEGQAFAWNDAK